MYYAHKLENIGIVGILTFMSIINTAFESWKARKFSIFQHFSFCERIKCHAQLS